MDEQEVCREYLIVDKRTMGFCLMPTPCRWTDSHATEQELDEWYRNMNERVKLLETRYQELANNERGQWNYHH